MIKQRYGRNNSKDLDRKVIVHQLATCLSQLFIEKEELKTPIDINKGFYVFISGSNAKCRGIKYFKAESVSGAERKLNEAVDYFINRCALQSKRLYVAIGYDYIYRDGSDTGAEDCIILGDEYPTRVNFEDVKRKYKDISQGEKDIMSTIWKKHLNKFCKSDYSSNKPCNNGCPCDRCHYDHDLNLAYHLTRI